MSTTKSTSTKSKSSVATKAPAGDTRLRRTAAAAPKPATTATKSPANKSEGSIKLSYFDGAGRCEHIRYMLAVAKLSYEDKRVSFDEWPKLKPDTPCKSLPMLEMDGEKFGQSIAVGRLVAQITKLYGSNFKENARIDEIVDSMTDIREATIAVAFFKGEESTKEEKTKELLETKIPPVLENVAARLGTKTYFVGDKLSWADIHFFTVMEMLEKNGYGGVLDKYKSLKKLNDTVAKLPQIKEWRDKRPKGVF